MTRNYFAWIVRSAIVAIVGLGFFYLMCLNSLATRGFALEAIKSERLAVQKEMDEVEIATAIPSTLYALGSSEQVQAMEIVDSKIFLKIQKDGVAILEKNTEKLNF